LAGCGIIKPYRITELKKEDIKIHAPQPKFRVGEKLTYKAEWLGIDVGTATLEVKEITEINGRKAYRIVAKAETSPMVSKLYKVEDVISTYIDAEEMYPLKCEGKQREGGHQKDDYVEFDQKNHKAYYFSRKNNEKKEYTVPEKVQDPLSCIYFFRIQDIKSGEAIFANVHLDDKNWLIEAKLVKKSILKIKGVGEWEAFMAKPLTWFQGELKNKAKVSIWFSADENRIPLLVVTSSIPFVGTITITLQKIEYLDTQ
jgi:hypothetical protein